MTSTVIDVETTIFQKGHPFAKRNRVCYYGAYPEGSTVSTYLANQLSDFQRQVDGATTLVGFNIKFDLHWLRRNGVNFRGRRIWDCQVARFLLEAQRVGLQDNNLDKTCKAYGIRGKLAGVEEYWEQGIDTPDIPEELMHEYLAQDLRATMEVYHKQVELFKLQPKLYNLFLLQMDDLLVLEEMEYNGLKFNIEKAQQEAGRIVNEIREIERQLGQRCPNTPVNWDSVDHLSAYLYGGTISVVRKEPAGYYKTGIKAGQLKFANVIDRHNLTRLLAPITGSELKKEGIWSAAEDVLKQLKQVKEVKLLLERTKLVKLSEYLIGLPEMVIAKDWQDLLIHGQFNQTIARTGRLTSSAPNLQNMPDPVLALMETRYV